MDTPALLRHLRREHGLTQDQLAALAGTSGPTIAAYESGRKQPRIDTLARIIACGSRQLTVERRPRTRAERLTRLLCRAYAEEVRARPRVLDEARTRLDEVYRGDERVQHVWRHLLDAGPGPVIAVLESDEERCQPLQSDTPFAGLGLIGERRRQTLVDQAYG